MTNIYIKTIKIQKGLLLFNKNILIPLHRIIYHFKREKMFNKETEYALRGLVYIQMQNTDGKRPGIAEISEQIDAPYFYTAKILQRLVRQGFVKSQKGKGGGFYFDSKQHDVSLKKLIIATEGDKLFNGCGFGLKQCDDNNPCPLHEKYALIRDALTKLVTEENVQSLARDILRNGEKYSPRLK
ncbi:MAG: Rrf2 family transcriptional regulator [Bacteroidales bacterium]|nr:Rrf2 family transcriptional regulator [Bacteroidales bacterium]